MAILLTSVVEAWRKKHTSKKTTSGLPNSTDNPITNHNETIICPNNTNTDIEPSGAANNGDHNATQRQHPQIIRIGVWPPGTFTGLSTENVEMTEPRAIARTGTDSSREEREVETSQGNHLANNSGSVSHSQEIQRLEWFMILVVLLVTLICEVILYVFAFGGNFIEAYLNIITTFSGIGIYTTIYIGIFVVLTEYHSAIGAFLERYLYFRRGYQPLCLRVFAYLYATCVLVRITLILWGYIIPVAWVLGFP